jgi:hypothetical protein
MALIANQLTGGNYFCLNDRPFLKELPLWQFALFSYFGTLAGFAVARLIAVFAVSLGERKRKAAF